MFGYVTIHKPELKIKEYEIYQSVYCGLCRTLHQEYGRCGQLTLTYDMAFLILLLNGLYEPRQTKERHRCIAHPEQRHWMTLGKYTEYGADMNMLLAYHNLMDDWADDRNVLSLAAATAIRRRCRRAARKYPRQNRAIIRELKRLQIYEKDKEMNIDKVSGCMGKLLGELFIYEKDVWSKSLYRLGFFLGKFIYLMDAYIDLDKDKRDGKYNPLIPLSDKEDFEEETLGMLNMMMAECAREFEKLPIVKNAQILRNILYSGVWERYAAVSGRQKRSGEDNKK